jgi:hypothetical protein
MLGSQKKPSEDGSFLYSELWPAITWPGIELTGWQRARQALALQQAALAQKCWEQPQRQKQGLRQQRVVLARQPVQVRQPVRVRAQQERRQGPERVLALSCHKQTERRRPTGRPEEATCSS